MNKIIINGRFLIQQVTGVQRYAREVLRELDKITEPGELMMAVPPETESIPDYRNIRVVKTGKLHNRLWEHISFPFFVRQQRGISLNLCNVAPLLSPGIVCIHDMKIKATPQYFNKGFLAWYNVLFANETRRARAIITVSQFSKEEIVKYYHVNPDRITVIPNGWQHYQRIGYDECALKKYHLEKNRYFFSICSLEPNKNFKWIAEVAKRNPERTFAVAGSINEEVFADGLGFECPDNMRLLGYISDEEAKALMRDCTAFLFPTFYEGFGIPPLEAISAGARRVLVSDTKVMHEVFGDGVIYIDPYSYQIDLDASPDSSEGEKILEKYSWTKSALRLKNLIEKVA